ncbi:hypothetical protein HX017_14390 [Myroides marinus]|uniref:DUF7017 domain-containing protein n=1 Tax=Myroides marinus TaxID=703342 RepID=UPI002575DCF0|nr:hypothetical protein [Myroides marinus]MDM1354653.1 hypothetical protein [Myroides marinus]MDM1366134.1 hypothetical protein [Myroides marinus]MDM1533684.1 hypothetical protein [Myroides marinus]MDM1540648.1 hypothetical protein [Myroides marinus]
MSSTDVNNLRKAGQLKEAFELAKSNLESNPTDIWNKRAISWVYYDYLKQAAEETKFDKFIHILQTMAQVQLPIEEEMLFDTLVWPINKIVYSLLKSKQWDNAKGDQLFAVMQQFNYPRHVENFSVLIKVLHKVFKGTYRYLDVIDWCGLESLKIKDFEAEIFEGRSIMPLAEQIYIGYAKHLTEGSIVDPNSNHRVYNIEKIMCFLPKLEKVIEQYPSYVFTQYFHVKLQLILGEGDILNSFIPFAKLKKNEFWTWQLLAEIYANDKDIVFSCYCKALSLRSKDEFLVRIRQQFAQLLIERECYAEAKTEIENIYKTKQLSGNKVPYIVEMWMNLPWYNSIEVKNSNYSFYTQYKAKAEEIIYSSNPEVIIAVEFVNTEKRIVNFIIDQNRTGFFKYGKEMSNPKIGDVYAVRFDDDVQDKRYRVLSIQRVEQEKSVAVKLGQGQVRIAEAGFGFIDDVFVDKNFLEKNNIIHNQQVTYKAILSFNKKKSQWGWRVFWLK